LLTRLNSINSNLLELLGVNGFSSPSLINQEIAEIGGRWF
jgi:hypothetical protein